MLNLLVACLVLFLIHEHELTIFHYITNQHIYILFLIDTFLSLISFSLPSIEQYVWMLIALKIIKNIVYISDNISNISNDIDIYKRPRNGFEVMHKNAHEQLLKQIGDKKLNLFEYTVKILTIYANDIGNDFIKMFKK